MYTIYYYNSKFFGKGVLPHKNDGGARRTFKGKKFVPWYRLEC